MQLNGDGNYSNGFIYNPVGIYENGDLYGLTIHPNPSQSGLFDLTFGDNSIENLQLQVVDLAGRVVRSISGSGSTTGKTHTIDLSNYPQGMYVLQVREENRVVINKKLIRLYPDIQILIFKAPDLFLL